MRRRDVCFVLASVLLAGSCQMEPMQRVKPERRRVGLTQVEQAQQDVDNTLEQYRRQREAARREALRDQDE